MLNKLFGGVAAVIAGIIFAILAFVSGITGFLTLILICGKAFGLLSWTWLGVFTPLLVVVGAWVVVLILAGLAAILLN